MPTRAQRERTERITGRRGRPTLEFLREILHYDPDTGVFTWRVLRGMTRIKPGDVAGNKVTVSSGHVYWQISIDSVMYSAHTLARFYMTGVWPPILVDHKDGNGLNNVYTNLRDATVAMNQHNRKCAQKGNSLGFMGVTRVTRKSGEDRFNARIKVNMRRVFLGQYLTAEEAGKAYLSAKRALHPGNLL